MSALLVGLTTINQMQGQSSVDARASERASVGGGKLNQAEKGGDGVGAKSQLHSHTSPADHLSHAR